MNVGQLRSLLAGVDQEAVVAVESRDMFGKHSAHHLTVDVTQWAVLFVPTGAVVTEEDVS